MQETYLDQSIAAADAIQKRFVRNLNRKNRTVKQAGFIVLKYTYMPSVLVETGFLTNRNEGAFLNSKKGQNDMAEAIASAIIDYKNTLAQSVVDAVQTTPNAAPKSTLSTAAVTKLEFSVQIAASQKSVGLESFNWKGLKGVFNEKQGKIYRYYYGKTPTYADAQRLLKIAKSKGYPSAFLVAFENGKKITLEQALR